MTTALMLMEKSKGETSLKCAENETSQVMNMNSDEVCLLRPLNLIVLCEEWFG